MAIYGCLPLENMFFTFRYIVECRQLLPAWPTIHKIQAKMSSNIVKHQRLAVSGITSYKYIVQDNIYPIYVSKQ